MAVYSYLGIPYAQAPVGNLRFAVSRFCLRFAGLQSVTRVCLWCFFSIFFIDLFFFRFVYFFRLYFRYELLLCAFSRRRNMSAGEIEHGWHVIINQFVRNCKIMCSMNHIMATIGETQWTTKTVCFWTFGHHKYVPRHAMHFEISFARNLLFWLENERKKKKIDEMSMQFSFCVTLQSRNSFLPFYPNRLVGRSIWKLFGAGDYHGRRAVLRLGAKSTDWFGFGCRRHCRRFDTIADERVWVAVVA